MAANESEAPIMYNTWSFASCCFRPDPIWNDEALGCFEGNKKKKNNNISRTWDQFQK